MKLSSWLAMVSATALLACKERAKVENTDFFTSKGDTIEILKATEVTGKIRTEIIRDEDFSLKITTAGTVKAIPTAYAEVAPPFQGRVMKSYLKLGMKTTPETPLFEIRSPDFITAQKTYFQEKSQMEQANRTLLRQKDLISHGVGSQKELEEAQTAYDVERREYENAVVGIKIFKANPEKMVFGQGLTVRAPISGEVLENKVVLGQYIKDDASSVAIIADLSKVWVAGQVKENDLRFIHPSQSCDISIAALPDKHLMGKVYHIEDQVDDDTRSIKILIEVANPDRNLKPGMYATVNFNGAPVRSTIVPAKALFQMNDSSFVFLKVAQGKFIKRTVITNASDADRVVIASGIKEGDEIVTEGGFYLLNAK